MSEISLLPHLTSNDQFKDLDEASLKGVEDELELVRLNRDEVLFNQDDSGDCMYVLISGQLVVRMRTADGKEIVVGEESEPGTSVGEMALVTGQARVVSVFAASEADLVKLSKKGFEYLAKKQPHILTDLAETTSRRWRRAQLAVILANLLGDFDTVTLRDLQAELEWQQLSHGEILFTQGEPGDAMYIVVNGRLRIVAILPDGSKTELDEIGTGEIVGEFTLITGEPRTATVYAIRETHLVRLTRPFFNRLVARYPQAMMQITRKIILRHPSSLRVSATESISSFNFALLPISPDVPLDEFTQNLAEGLAEFGRVLHLNSTRLDCIHEKEGIAQISLDDPTAVVLDSWLSEQEVKFNYILYVADPSESTWTRRCVRQADRLLLVGLSDDSPRPTSLEIDMRMIAVTTRAELVLLHGDRVTRPIGTAGWLAQRKVSAHHHVCIDEKAHYQRLARRLAGRATGLVLSGGGARGFAHLGVVRALEEEGLEIDFVGGTSMGALLGAGYAMGKGSKEMFALAGQLANPRQLFDYTLPMASLMASKKVTNVLYQVYGELQIEDLWRPFFCISSNLTKAEPVLHRSGSLWKSVRASIAIPGVFTPVMHEGDVLVDGAAMNNFPVDIMRRHCEQGMVIGVNVSPPEEQKGAYRFGTSLSGWHILWGRLNPFIRPVEAPSLITNIIRALEIDSVHKIKREQSLADLLIQPEVKRFGILDFAAYEAISEVGYREAKKELAHLELQRFKRLSERLSNQIEQKIESLD